MVVPGCNHGPESSEDMVAAALLLHLDQEHAAGAAVACQWEPAPVAVEDVAGPQPGRMGFAPKVAHGRAGGAGWGNMVPGELCECTELSVPSRGSDKCHPSGKKHPLRGLKTAVTGSKPALRSFAFTSQGDPALPHLDAGTTEPRPAAPGVGLVPAPSPLS